ncbi:MAG: glycosyltransferase [Terracidiphilus sp.]
MLKIAVVTRYFPSSAEPWQGRSAYQSLRVLARKADVQVFFPNAKYPSLLRPRSRMYDNLDRAYHTPDVKVTYYDYPALPLVSRPLNGWMAARVLLPHVRSFAPSLVFSFFLYPEGFAALQIAKTLGVPAIAMAIGSDINNIGDRISAARTHTVLREADLIAAVCDDLRKKAVIMGAPAAKTRTVHNGCDLSVFHMRDRTQARKMLQIDPATEAVVYIGRMDVKKGLRELIDAAASLHPQRPQMHVYLVGAGPDQTTIQGAIQAANAASYIHLPGPCSPSDVAVWMAASDLVTLPSYMEGCPNVVLEALACGRPVVATDAGGIPELLNGDCGRLVPPRDSIALAAALASVLNRSWDANSISARMSRSWDTVAAELLEIFETLVPVRHATEKVAVKPQCEPEDRV